MQLPVPQYHDFRCKLQATAFFKAVDYDTVALLAGLQYFSPSLIKYDPVFETKI